jgi:hypothetical protein
MLPPGATAGGYHVANHADWRHKAPMEGLCYPGVLTQGARGPSPLAPTIPSSPTHLPSKLYAIAWKSPTDSPDGG